MKKILVVMLLVPFTFIQSTAQVDSNFHVYLLVGQSNMAGRGVLDAESKKINERIWMMDSLHQWVLATDPLHFDKPAMVGVGPGIAFASEMLKESNHIKVGLIPCALGGSPIKVWEPGNIYLDKFHPWEDAIMRTQLAMKKGVLKGIIWHQGESDNDSALAVIYLDKLIALINRFRNEFKQPNLPFVAGEIGHFNTKTIINDMINQLPARLANTAVVSATGLTDKGDHLHFDTPSARELGKRYAEAMKRFIRK